MGVGRTCEAGRVHNERMRVVETMEKAVWRDTAECVTAPRWLLRCALRSAGRHTAESHSEGLMWPCQLM